MFGTDAIGPGPMVTPIQELEFRYQVRRLSQHPSLVLYSGCNECGGQGLYTTFVMQTVVQEDQSRPIRSSSPWTGYSKGVHLLSQLPTGGVLVAEPTGSAPSADPGPPWFVGQELHGPYQHGGLFPSVNNAGGLFVPPTVVSVQPAYPTGPAVGGYFRSETGCSVMSSFESMSGTLTPNNYGLHTPPFHQRNYPCDNIIESYFGTQNFTVVGEEPFKRVLYLCMLAQGIQRKTDIESWRSTNDWGILMWQLNEIWPTGGYVSLLALLLNLIL